MKDKASDRRIGIGLLLIGVGVSRYISGVAEDIENAWVFIVLGIISILYYVGKYKMPIKEGAGKKAMIFFSFIGLVVWAGIDQQYYFNRREDSISGMAYIAGYNSEYFPLGLILLIISIIVGGYYLSKK